MMVVSANQQKKMDVNIYITVKTQGGFLWTHHERTILCLFFGGGELINLQYLLFLSLAQQTEDIRLYS